MLGKKFDNGKPRWSLLPWREVQQIVDVLTFGAEKYDVDNWKHVDNYVDRYSSALMRHLTAWFQGERRDRESGFSHLAHAGCCLLFLMWKNNGGCSEEAEEITLLQEDAEKVGVACYEVEDEQERGSS
jgi:hypothetical protein